MSMSHTFSPGASQRGMALVVALIFLLIMSLLAASSVQDVTLQESVAGNQRDHAIAFQAAEAALQEAEAQADEENGVSMTPWDGSDASMESATVDGGPQMARSPRYHVWHPEGLAGQANEGDDATAERRVYQIHAVGYGGSPNSRVVLQSWYIPHH